MVCNHNPNDKKSTLVLLPQRKMVFPMNYNFFCPYCKNTFIFQKNIDGKYSELNNK